MKRLLVICPSINRSSRIQRFLKSFKETKSEGTDLILGLDQNDHEFALYHNLSNEYDFGIGLFAGENITKILNRIALEGSNDYEYFMPTNDDFVFETPHWDSLLIQEIESKGKGIAYGNDLFQNAYPSTSVISGDIVRALGYLQLPTLTHLCGDIVWKTIGEYANCLYYRPDIIIKHEHYLPMQEEQDLVYKRTNSKAMYEKDQGEFAKWLATKAHEDIEKVKKICQIVNV